MTYWSKRKKEVRFGLQMAVFFVAVIFYYLPWAFSYQRKPWPLFVAGVFLLCVIAAPIVLAPLEKFWEKVVRVLGVVKTHVLMFLIFSVIFVPIGLYFRLIKRDPLHRRFDSEAKSYKIKADKPDLVPNMQRIF